MRVSAPEQGASTLDTVVIPLAGLGTRMYPFTAEVPKFMSPVIHGDRATPSIDYTLGDCLDAGIKNFVFVISRDGDETLRRYLGPIDPEVEAAMVDLGKRKDLEVEKARRAAFSDASGINIEFVKQPLSGGKYGTAVPVHLAQSALAGVEHFAVYGGDSFVWRPDGTSELRAMTAAWQQSGAENALMGTPVPRSKASSYGILQQQNSRLTHIDEKPPIERVPEVPLANAIGYIMNSGLLDYVQAEIERPRTSSQPEYYLTDVVNTAVSEGHDFFVHSIQGAYLDAGLPQNLLDTSNFLTSK
jgi:UTP--glucose-1-phosphate uridylyltransferase